MSKFQISSFLNNYGYEKNRQRTVVKDLVSSTEYFLNFIMNYYGNCIVRNFVKRGDQLKIPAKGGLQEKGGLPIIKGGLGTLDETMKWHKLD